MRVKKIKLYTFDELSEAAKENAREWWREDGGDAFQWNSQDVVEDASRIAEMLGIEFLTHPVKLMSGKTRYDPSVWWYSLDYGGWVYFEATYRYKKGGVKAVKDYAPQDTELHSIAEKLQQAQKKHFYKLIATCSIVHREHMGVEVEHSDGIDVDISEASSDVKQAIKSFANWIYKWLVEEYRWTYSDEYVDETIRANEYEFTEDGERMS